MLLAEPLPTQLNTPSQLCGVSLAWLRQFVSGCEDVVEVANTEQLVQQAVAPITRAGRLRLWDLVPVTCRGPPDWYIVHT